MSNPIRTIADYFQKTIWLIDPAPLTRPARLGLHSARLLYVIVQEISAGMLTLRAMGLVYTTLLSLVPLIAVSFSILKGFGVHNQVEPLLLNFVAPLGEKGIEVVDKLLFFVENMRVGVLGAVGMGLLLYTVVSLIQKIESAFNDIWCTSSERSLSRRFSDYLSVLTIGPVLVFSAMGVTATILNSNVVQTLIAIEPFGSLFLFLGKLVPYLFVIAAFTFFYMFVPNTQVNFRSALVGGIGGGILWETTGLLFASFAAASTKYAAIYSGFAILIMFMIWLYVSWLILLIGVHIAYLHQHPDQIRPGRSKLQLSSRQREVKGLTIMALIADHHINGGEGWTLARLAQRVQLPEQTTVELLEILSGAGLICASDQQPANHLLIRDPTALPLLTVLTTLRQAGESELLLDATVTNVATVEQLFTQLSEVRGETLRGKSVRDLVI